MKKLLALLLALCMIVPVCLAEAAPAPDDALHGFALVDSREFPLYNAVVCRYVHERTGAEVIHICPMDALTPAEPLPGGADGRKLDGGPRGSAVELEAGWFCAIFPGEAHMVGGRAPSGAPGIEKWVVKAACPREWCVEA